MTRAGADEFLRSHGAQDVPHLNGTLLEHLEGTAAVLERWGASDDLVLAGLCHASYGTDGFAPSLLPLTGRAVLREAIGDRAEATVYRYASCDRSAVYPRFVDDGPIRFRDRFTGVESTLSDDELRDFVDLTFANELEIVIAARGVDKLDVISLLTAIAPRASTEARAELERVRA